MHTYVHTYRRGGGRLLCRFLLHIPSLPHVYNQATSCRPYCSVVSVSFYYINYYYLEDLVLVDFLEARIFLENKNEVGITVSLPKYLGLAEHFLLPVNPRIGLGVQFVGDARLYRLVFGVPFF